MVPGSSAALATIGTAEVANARAPDMNVLKRTLRKARREMCILSPPKTCPERARYRSDDANRSGYLPPPLATGCDRTPRPGLGAQTNDVLQLVPCSNLPCPAKRRQSARYCSSRSCALTAPYATGDFAQG